MANFPTWYNQYFSKECKEEIVEPQNLEQFRKEYRDDIAGIIKHVLTPRTETVVPYGTGINDTVENEIAWRWSLFISQTVAGDLYRKENFRESFPELFTVLKNHKVFYYDGELKEAKVNPDYGTLEKGSVI